MPFNGGPSPAQAARWFVTPLEHFFVRAHAMDVPRIDPTTYTLDVGGLVRTPLTLSLDELRSRFETRQLIATMQCAGNRRDQLMTVEPITGEIPWSIEAISNGLWEGARLSDVLDASGSDVSGHAAHVEFIGLDAIDRHGQTFGYGGSIPLEKARAPEVLLAWSMNGKPLLPIHGYPLRVVVPGFIGARSVKWLKQINLLATPSKNYFQSHAYKLFPPSAKPTNVDWTTGQTLGEFAVNSAITSPQASAMLPPGELTIKGWAIAGGRSVDRVDVSTDGGTNWTGATFVEPAGESTPWTWRIWESRAMLSPGTHQLVVRATDCAGNAQPAEARALWNFKGYMNNAWHRVNIAVTS